MQPFLHRRSADILRQVRVRVKARARARVRVRVRARARARVRVRVRVGWDATSSSRCCLSRSMVKRVRAEPGSPG